MINSLKRTIVIATIFSLLILSVPVVPRINASSLTSVRDTISNSAPEATDVTHTFDFTTGTALEIGHRIDITFPAEFTDIVVGNVTCPANTDESVTGQIVRCTATAALATSSYEVTVAGVTNPSKTNPEGIADTYQISIETTNADGSTVFERADAMIAIIEPVTVTATVDAILEFSISGVDQGESIKNTTASVTSTTTTIPFGTLPIGDSVVAGQDLRVRTNASQGYSVVVFQDQDLSSAAGDEISCFNQGTCVDYTTPTGWAQPLGTIDEIETYGHFGFTSEDEGVAGSCLDDGDYGTGFYGAQAADLWAGFDGTNQATVMCHTGPSDGSTLHKGFNRVGYRVEITAMQAAGEYTNILTYIATPTY